MVGVSRPAGSPRRAPSRTLPRASVEEANAGDADSDPGLTLRLPFQRPFAWRAALSFLAVRATPGVECVRGQAYWRTVRVPFDGRVLAGWICVHQTPEETFLRVRMAPALEPVGETLGLRLRRFFDLDAEPLRIEAHLRADPAFLPLVEGMPGLRVLGCWDPFELACRAVLGQQVSVAAATTLSGRLAERFGAASGSPVPGLAWLAPSAPEIAQTSVDDIAALGMPRARAATVLALARFAAAGGLAAQSEASLEEVVKRLITLPGIGEWTAQYIAMRGFGQADAFPAGDLGLRRALARLEGTAGLPAERALLARSAAWMPWRAYAAVHLWRLAALPAA